MGFTLKTLSRKLYFKIMHFIHKKKKDLCHMFARTRLKCVWTPDWFFSISVLPSCQELIYCKYLNLIDIRYGRDYFWFCVTFIHVVLIQTPAISVWGLEYHKISLKKKLCNFIRKWCPWTQNLHSITNSWMITQSDCALKEKGITTA